MGMNLFKSVNIIQFICRKLVLIFNILILLILSYNISFAQKESNIWYFGYDAGITFSTTPPTILTDGKMNAMQGCATICDSNGNLLFYTNGVTVRNKIHSIMDNGDGLNGGRSSSQSSIIVPKPGCKTIYYIFTTDEIGYMWSTKGLQYSEVDISMNGGLGKVIRKNIILIQPSSEKLTVASHKNNKDFWVITYGYKNNNFYCFLVTSAGVDSIPVISSRSGPIDNLDLFGYIKTSNDNKKLALVCLSGLELFVFDNNSGKIFNKQVIDTNSTDTTYLSNPFYAVEFSASCNKLYATRWNSSYQYNLLSCDIPRSRKLIYSNKRNYCGLQIGLDDNIYLSNSGSHYLNIIKNADADSCSLKDSIFLGGKICQFDLPNFVPSFIIKEKPPVASIRVSDTIICQGEKISLSLKDTCNKSISSQKWYIDGILFDTLKSTNYLFNNFGNFKISVVVFKDTLSDTAELVVHVNPVKQIVVNPKICQNDTFSIGFHHYTNTGTYYDTLITFKGCDSIITTHLNVYPIEKINLNPVICEGDTFSVGFSKYTNAGLYTDSLKTYFGCDSIVKTYIQVNKSKNIFIPTDTVVCFENVTQLLLDAGLALEYLWYPSMETGRYLVVNTEGKYSLEIKDSIGCKSFDSIKVISICKMTIFVPNAFVPNGINSVFKVYGTGIENITLVIYNRWGELLYKGNGDSDISWNGKFHNELCPVDAYYYYIKAVGRKGETQELTGTVNLLK
jgi:gliding motility-associated-like protein